MILVEPGTFAMGSSNRNVQFSESPAHQVTLTQSYLMGETEVTEALWNAVYAYDVCYEGDRYPVEMMTNIALQIQEKNRS